MPQPEFLSFTPVPLKDRHDGWRPRLQFQFVLALARGASVDAAAEAVGKSRTTAYALRKRPGSESFAAAWDSALAYARRMRLAARRAAAAPPPSPSTPDEAAALLDRLYPGWRGKAGEAREGDKADEADRA
jgi:hypothetical protein